MSFDKLIAAATDYFTTGAELHRSKTSAADTLLAYYKSTTDVNHRALAGGGGKIVDLSEPATKKAAPKATKTGATVDETATAESKAATEETKRAEEAAAFIAKGLVAKAAAEAKAAAVEQALAADELREHDLDGAPPISYEEDIRPVLRAKSLANRDALVALLGKFNVKSGQELTADQYPAFLAGLKAI